MSSTGKIRPREDDAPADRETKRLKSDRMSGDTEMETATSTSLHEPRYDMQNLLPPSLTLLELSIGQEQSDVVHSIVEVDVGISQYVGKDVPPIQGIIKQRFTDFLVFEVDLQGKEIHVQSIGLPESSESDAKGLIDVGLVQDSEDAPLVIGTPNINIGSLEEEKAVSEESSWPERFTITLTPFLSMAAISKLEEMFLQGPKPPVVSDEGWGGRKVKLESEHTTYGEEGQSSEALEGSHSTQVVESKEDEMGPQSSDRGTSGKTVQRRKGGARGGAGRGKSGRLAKVDSRHVLSDVIKSKDTRKQLHDTIRELFSGALESVTGEASDEGSRILIRWRKKGDGRRDGDRGKVGNSRGGRSDAFIHFTMQKTNRDTQDALSHLARVLKVEPRDLAVCGTKDKRGVTVQRVSLKRNGKSIEHVWKTVNGTQSRRSMDQALTERGERGVRISDLEYKKSGLQLGMLKGNAFVITLRNVKADSMGTLERAMESIKSKGFINYYGMQRFGTASIPTHAIGLALLKSDWATAVSLILRPRPGEFSEAEAARRAWLEDGDLDKALMLMPKRIVAERCILESFQKQGGDSRNLMGALSTIPRNLRMMYVHAYQSYVWNAIVSERIKKFGCEKPVVGDIVFARETSERDDLDVHQAEEMAVEDPDEIAPVVTADSKTKNSSSRNRKPSAVLPIKVLGPEDLDKYSIFDVVMPLPGTDVSFPGGDLGDLYREFLVLDGLDPTNFIRKQREYTLGGSYRKILHLPKHISWSVLRYTDPDVPLAQSDEDRLLGFDPPAHNEGGQFLALQLRLTLGTAAYATMALREVTKTDTSSHVQTSLTLASEDQKFRGTAGSAGVDK